MLKKATVLTRPSPAHRDAPFRGQGRSEQVAGGTYQALLEPLASITCERIGPLPQVGLYTVSL